MTKKERIALFNKIYSDNERTMFIRICDTKRGFHSYIMSREIIIPKEAYDNLDDWDIFAFLHEVGHIKTNTNKMKRCQQEYLATQWAIDEAKKIGFKVPSTYIRIYQNYIWKWRATAIKLKAKSVPTIKELTLTV